MNPSNALYVMTQGAYLRKDHENVVVTVEREEKLRLPLVAISSVVCFGRVSASPELMSYCAELGIGFAYLSENGRFLCRVEGRESGNVLLRRAQYRVAGDAAATLAVARMIVAAKVQSSRTALRRAVSDHGEKVPAARIDEVLSTFGGIIRAIESCEDIDALRGLEGAAAHAYFSVFDALITNQKEDFSFEKRTRRPPLDRVNALLSFIYTLLQHDCASALSATGLDYQVGFLHEDRPGRPSLALDLMEEFRAGLADRLVLSLINRKQVTGDGFITRENGAVEMSPDVRKLVVAEYQKRKTDALTHPFTNEATTWGLLPHVQARLLARTLRGDLDTYPAFAWQ